MLAAFCKAWFERDGWTIDSKAFDEHPRSVVTAAPHTSNMDFVFTMAAFEKIGLPKRFAIKREWMKPPFSWALGPMGALPIDRRPRLEGEERPSAVDGMVRIFEDNPGPLALVIAPEGTRSLRKRWKTGFYHVAVGANVPIMLGYLDYRDKRAGIGDVIVPSGDMDADMRRMMAFYATTQPSVPEKFALDERWAPQTDNAG